METIVGVLTIGAAIALTILAAITARTSSVSSMRRTYAQTNAGMESPASIGTAGLAIKDFLTRNSLIIVASAILGVFFLVTMVRPSSFLPAHEESASFSTGSIMIDFRTKTGPRHVEEGDAFEVDLAVSGKRANRAKCPAASLTATAVAPGAEIVPAKRLYVSDISCSGSAKWLVGTKTHGRIIVAVTLADRDARTRTISDVASAVVGATSSAERN